MNPLTASETTPSATNTGWHSERLFDQGQAYFSALIDDIDRAQYSIELESYIFANDSVGTRVAQALHKAQQRGLSVRVIMDGIGSYQFSQDCAERLEKSGIEVKIFHPLPWQSRHYRRSLKSGSALNKALYFFWCINQRDHRKLCIIDRQHLWSGSFNIRADHLPIHLGGKGWRDYGLCVKGPAVAEIAQQFNALWHREHTRFGHGLFKLYWNNVNLWARKHKNQLLRLRIQTAQKRVWIVSAYFAPSSRVIRALIGARQRNLDVRIIVPAQSDVHLFPFLTATYYADLIKAGIHIYEYQPGVLHAKAIIIDDLHLIGSTNFNHRSFLHDLELDIQLNKKGSQQQLQAWLKQDLASSNRVDLTRRHFHISNWLLGKFARLLRYWM